jgi:hypothetical protein
MVFRLKPLINALVIGIGVCMLSAAPASAEVSSVDAYGGAAAVLGKPRHSHANGSSTGRSVGGEARGGAATSAGSGSGGGTGAGRTSRSRRGASGAPQLAQQRPATTPAVTAGDSSALGGLDLPLLIVGLVGLVAVGLAVRSLARPARV